MIMDLPHPALPSRSRRGNCCSERGCASQNLYSSVLRIQLQLPGGFFTWLNSVILWLLLSESRPAAKPFEQQSVMGRLASRESLTRAEGGTVGVIYEGCSLLRLFLA
jgi:hypothetical protein